MLRWNSSPHPISDVRDWDATERLELTPSWQRGAVWSPDAKVMLIDSILKGIPMPKLLLQAILRNEQTYRVVIDGQQRLRAILEFLRDEFVLESPPCDPAYAGAKYSTLTQDARNKVLQYKLDFNEIYDATDTELREIYTRVNKYNIQLNQQELRRADYPGDFLRVSEGIANLESLEKAKIFTPAHRRRMLDVEYVSELLAALLRGPQDKKETLNAIYKELMVWNEAERNAIRVRFEHAVGSINRLFPQHRRKLSGTRFRQRSDFYGLLVAVDALLTAGGSLDEKDLGPLQTDLLMMDDDTGPESQVAPFRDYAIRCVSDANAVNSRRWRTAFLTHFLTGTYRSVPPTPDGAALFREIAFENDEPSMGGPPTPCSVCGAPLFAAGIASVITAWRRMDRPVFQYSNCSMIHKACAATDAARWTIVEPADEYRR